MASRPSSRLDDGSVALLESSHAAKAVAVADAGHRATVAYAYACQVDRARGRVRVTVEREQARPVLAALEVTGRITLVASDIETFTSLQVKGDGARLVALTPAERSAVAAHCEEFSRFAATIGYDRTVMVAHMGCRADNAVGIEFAVRQAFVQTPGPRAGEPLDPQ